MEPGRLTRYCPPTARAYLRGVDFKLIPRSAAAIVAGLTVAACGTPETTTPETTTAEADVAERDAGTAVAKTTDDAPLGDAFDTEPVRGANYGAGVAADANPMVYDDFVQLVATHDSATTTVRGTVVEVCQKKGCWMTLRPTGAIPASEPYLVRFKDYGFFMPKTLSGAEVVVEGTARRSVTPVDELRHYAEDAGRSPAEVAAITAPREEITLEATGVRVL